MSSDFVRTAVRSDHSVMWRLEGQSKIQPDQDDDFYIFHYSKKTTILLNKIDHR